jgi:outer membrane murein-binding lipoprotein Lpp
MDMLKLSSVVLAGLFILGCAPKQAPDPAPPPAKTVFDPLTQNLDKARAVQQAADANADATRKAVDSQERGDSTP